MTVTGSGARGDDRQIVLDIRGVTKHHGGLRPLRLAALTLAAGDRVSLGGIDAAAGEVLINLVTGASVPDTGSVRVRGRATTDIKDGDEWLAWLDQFGIVSPRAVLLEGSTLLQNLALPFTLDVDPVPAAVVERVRALARRCGILPEWIDRRAGDLGADVRVRAQLARALAAEPALVILEHPTAGVEEPAGEGLARDVVAACSGGAVAVLALTNDDAFGSRVAPRNLRLDRATGAVRPLRRGWFGSRR